MIKYQKSKQPVGFNMVADLIGEAETTMLFECCDKLGRISIPTVLRRGHVSALIGMPKAEILYDNLRGQRIKITDQRATYMEHIIKACLVARIPEYYLEQSLDIQRDEMRLIIKKVLPTIPT